MPRRPRTRGRTFDARARLCAAKIHAPNINQRCPRSWIQLTCLVGTVRERLFLFFCFSNVGVGVFPSFAYDPTPDGKDDTHVPRVPSRAPEEPRRDSCCRPRLFVSVRCVFLRAFIPRACLPRCWVAERSAVTRSVQVLRSERAFVKLIEADPSASR